VGVRNDSHGYDSSGDRRRFGMTVTATATAAVSSQYPVASHCNDNNSRGNHSNNHGNSNNNYYRYPDLTVAAPWGHPRLTSPACLTAGAVAVTMAADNAAMAAGKGHVPISGSRLSWFR
jgi:hypothetical protein